MDDRTDLLAQLSQALAARAEEASASVVAVWGELSGVLWQGEVVATSAQSLPRREGYAVVGRDGTSREAALAGVDAATNIAALRLAEPLPAQPLVARVPRPGEAVMAYGMDRSGSVSARLGTMNAVGGAWHSLKGGHIDSRLALDIRLGRTEEGGPVFDTSGRFVGMSTFGPYRRVIAIPAATLERVIPVLLKDGRVARGWLGIGLHPVAVPERFREETGQSAALMAMSIAPGGPAVKAGLLAGDIVLSVDGRVSQPFRNVLSGLGPDSIGRRVEVRVIRSGAVQTLSLTVEARPDE